MISRTMAADQNINVFGTILNVFKGQNFGYVKHFYMVACTPVAQAVSQT